jgi:hydroxymethylbilane synthase
MTQNLAHRLPVRIGTRGSPLALRQAEMVADMLQQNCPALGKPGAVEIVIIKTSGDMTQTGDKPLSEAGNKGLWTKEIEDALLAERIDLAVHCMKDMPTVLPEGLEIGVMLERADPRDAFFSRDGSNLKTLPAGSVVGTASLRRQALVQALRPDLKVVPLRGNVGTRLDKLAAGQVDATLLAMAGLERLGLLDKVTCPLEADEFLPAIAQGALGLEVRSNDVELKALLMVLHCARTGLLVTAERALLAALDGSCKTPIAGLATTTDDVTLTLKALIARPDGSEIIARQISGPMVKAFDLGTQLGQELKRLAPEGFFSHDCAAH